MSALLLAVTCLALPSAQARPNRAGADPKLSVVRIVNHSQRTDWASPWDAARVAESSGSGFVVDGGLVMTNAHVVSDSRLLLIYREEDAGPHEARVVHIAHDCDLALIRPLDPAALEGVAPVRFGGLPTLGSEVDTLGYPAGGVRLSLTRGVVSRIEEQVYVHSGVDAHLAVQTDAAINPGASGGPVLQEGRVVGVAFQASSRLENVGFFIPTEVIERFLQDVVDGRYDGYPDLGIETSTLENPAARAWAGMAPDESGVRVSRLIAGGSARGQLELGDVLLEAEGRKVANDGTVQDGPDRIPFGLLVDRKFIGEPVRLRMLRAGKRHDVSITLSRAGSLDSRRRAYDQTGRYYIHGGLIFVPLSREFLETYGADWRRDAPRAFQDVFNFRALLDPLGFVKERVVLLRMLEDPVNTEIPWSREQVVERVNGRTIDSLQALVEAIEQNRQTHHVIEFAHSGRFAVLNRARAAEANARILERYGIARDRRL